jgi:hypothetical protein
LEFLDENLSDLLCQPIFDLFEQGIASGLLRPQKDEDKVAPKIRGENKEAKTPTSTLVAIISYHLPTTARSKHEW